MSKVVATEPSTIHRNRHLLHLDVPIAVHATIVTLPLILVPFRATLFNRRGLDAHFIQLGYQLRDMFQQGRVGMFLILVKLWNKI